jgi:hypothetical protein
MGLDMFLYKTTRVKNFEDLPQMPRYAVTVTRDGQPLPDVTAERIVEIVEEIGYWRKNYFVHHWLKANLDHAARGDGFFEARVSREELARLLMDANEELASRTGLSQEERSELLRTRTILQSALAEGDETFTYKADW